MYLDLNLASISLSGIGVHSIMFFFAALDIKIATPSLWLLSFLLPEYIIVLGDLVALRNAHFAYQYHNNLLPPSFDNFFQSVSSKLKIVETFPSLAFYYSKPDNVHAKGLG